MLKYVVYIVHLKSSHGRVVKIGWSGNWEQRFYQLNHEQVANFISFYRKDPSIMLSYDVVRIIPCSTKWQAKEMEDCLKAHYSYCAMPFEHFEMGEAEVDKIRSAGGDEYLKGMLRGCGPTTIASCVAAGMIHAKATIYTNYLGKDGRNGEQVFLDDMKEIGANPPPEVIGPNPHGSCKFNGGRPKGAWTGYAYLDPPPDGLLHARVKTAIRDACEGRSATKRYKKRGIQACSISAFKAVAPLLWPSCSR
jgi:hypothetical protein